MFPSTTPMRNAWDELPCVALELVLTVRRPQSPGVKALAELWLTEFAAVTQAFVDLSGPEPYVSLSRIGSDLGRGEWSGQYSPRNLRRVVDSYDEYDGGVSGWYMGDMKTTEDQTLAYARSSLLSDGDRHITGKALACFVDRDGRWLPRGFEAGWRDVLARMASEFDVLHAEIRPGLSDSPSGLTNYEQRSGRRGTYQVTHLQIEQRLRGCSWVTWLPERFVGLIGEQAVHDSDVFHRVTRIDDRGLLLQATARSHEFTHDKERDIERLLLPALEPEPPLHE